MRAWLPCTAPSMGALMFLFLASGGVLAQTLDHPRVLGVAIYKEQGFLPDRSAVAVEYTRTNFRAGVVRFWTLKGSVITVQKNASVFFVPYPGKDPEVDAEGALLLVGLGEKRFPQYARLWKNLENAWRIYEAKDAEAREQEIAVVRVRENFLQQTLDWLLGKQFSTSRKEEQGTLLPEQPPGTSTRPARTNAEADSPEKPKTGDSFQKTREYKAVREYYELANELIEE